MLFAKLPVIPCYPRAKIKCFVMNENSLEEEKKQNPVLGLLLTSPCNERGICETIGR